MKEVQDYIAKEFGGTKVAVKKGNLLFGRIRDSLSLLKLISLIRITIRLTSYRQPHNFSHLHHSGGNTNYLKTSRNLMNSSFKSGFSVSAIFVFSMSAVTI